MVNVTTKSAFHWLILLYLTESFILANQMFPPGLTKQYISSKYPRTDFDRKMKEKQRKDEIRRKICDILRCRHNISLTTTPSPEPPTRYPILPKEFRDTKLVFSEPSAQTNDTHCMQFRLPESYFQQGVELNGADVFVHIKIKKRRKRRRRRNIVLRVSKLADDTSKRKIIARLRFQPTETKWYKVPLPVTLVRNLHKLSNKAFSLCIQCKKCNRKMRITFPLATSRGKRRKGRKARRKSKSKKRKSHRNLKSRRLRRNRPFLVCHVQKKLLQSTKSIF